MKKIVLSLALLLTACGGAPFAPEQSDVRVVEVDAPEDAGPPAPDASPDSGGIKDPAPDAGPPAEDAAPPPPPFDAGDPAAFTACMNECYAVWQTACGNEETRCGCTTCPTANAAKLSCEETQCGFTP